MGHSRLEYYLHLVWATYRREPLLAGDTEELIYACIRAEAKHMGCVVHALGGLEDHTHLVVEPPGMFAPSQVAQQVKGASSRFANSKNIAFRWQAGFAGFSLSRPHLKAAVPYVLTQRQRHDGGDIWQAWEPDYD